MATSSNFGNMFSAAAASVFLSFLPMLPSQILLNNLLYNAGQLAIPTDAVDPETLSRPAAWDIGFVRRFMIVFGPVSSVFDFLTFFVMLDLLHAGHSEFRTGWFVESLATQTLVIFVIRTRRVPFVRSRPSIGMLIVPTTCAAIGAVVPVHTGGASPGVRPTPARLLSDPLRHGRHVPRIGRSRKDRLLRGPPAAIQQGADDLSRAPCTTSVQAAEPLQPSWSAERPAFPKHRCLINRWHRAV